MTIKHLPLLCLILLLGTGAAIAQPVAAPLAFEAATVRPSAPFDGEAVQSGKAHVGTRIDASHVDIGTATLFRLICTAYKVWPYQVSGPDWLKTTTYDIEAKIPDGVSPDKVPEMLQALLAERFGLKFHIEKKDQNVYALVVGPGGIKMKESEPEPPAPSPAPGAPKPQEMSVPTLQGDVRLVRTENGVGIEMPGGEISGRIRASVVRQGGSGQPQKIHLESSGTTMKSFSEMLSVGVVGKPVVDMTGLTGRYEVAVDLSLDDAMNVARTSVTLIPTEGGKGNGGGDRDGGAPGAGLADPSGSLIFTSIQNLGLKLDARKLPLDMLVIDHMEKAPTAN